MEFFAPALFLNQPGRGGPLGSRVRSPAQPPNRHRYDRPEQPDP